MIRNNKGETIVGILIGVFIVSIVILGIASLINYSRVTIQSYDRSTKIAILRENLTNIIQAINLDWVLENEIFYVYKNTSTNTYEIFTGSSNNRYKYINSEGELVVDLENYERDIYARQLWIEREDTSLQNSNKLIRASIRRLIKQ